jgi:hypothetical protein
VEPSLAGGGGADECGGEPDAEEDLGEEVVVAEHLGHGVRRHVVFHVREFCRRNHCRELISVEAGGLGLFSFYRELDRGRAIEVLLGRLNDRTASLGLLRRWNASPQEFRINAVLTKRKKRQHSQADRECACCSRVRKRKKKIILTSSI